MYVCDPLLFPGLPLQEAPQQAGAPAVDELPPPKPDLQAPPPYEEEDNGAHVPQTGDIQPPSYEEVQRLKALEVGEDFPMPLCQVSVT